MKTYLIHEPFNIYHFTSRTWEHPEHKHTYYEIIFILRGKGIHLLNGKALKYGKDDIFFLGPDDFHSFQIRQETEFCYIRFTNTSSGVANSMKNFVSTPASGFRITGATDKAHLFAMLNVLRSEYENRFRPGFDEIRDGLMKAMMAVLSRNIQHQTSVEMSHREVDVGDLVAYVREQINSPDKLTIPHLASRFNYSPTYISYYFKQRTGEALKSFIIRTRLKLVETRLLYSNASLAEIAFEFGFTDESHLCKQFRKYTGVTPAYFRKRA
jgi:AraC family L-rhamnose operon regulatory protein RhaS